MAEIFRLEECGKFDAKFAEYRRAKRLIGAVLATYTSTQIETCVRKCITFKQCKSFNFLSDQELCELNSKIVGETGVHLQQDQGWLYAHTSVNQTKVNIVITSYAFIYPTT